MLANAVLLGPGLWHASFGPLSQGRAHTVLSAGGFCDVITAISDKIDFISTGKLLRDYFWFYFL